MDDNWKPYREREAHTQFLLVPSQLLPFIQTIEGFIWPRPMRADADGRDPTKYWDYHREHGHVTDHCQHFAYLLKTLLKRCHLEQYVLKLGKAAAHAQNSSHWNSIHLEIESHMVCKILVDPRSAADFLYLPALLQMGYQLTSLHSPGRILTSFNGSQAESLGEIMLLFTVGPTTMFVIFSFLNEPSFFNVTLGRTWLLTLKVVPSTYHQTLSFLTDRGQIDIHGDQKVARSCCTVGAQDDMRATK